MNCIKCPVMEKCLAAKADMAKTVEPDSEGVVAQKLKGICPLEMAVELQVGVLKITLQKMLKGISEKHG